MPLYVNISNIISKDVKTRPTNQENYVTEFIDLLIVKVN